MTAFIISPVIPVSAGLGPVVGRDPGTDDWTGDRSPVPARPRIRSGGVRNDGCAITPYRPTKLGFSFARNAL
jgi:hypothetical protein